MKGSANAKPERLVKGHGKTHYNYNIKQVTVEEPDGTSRKAYEYNYVVIIGKITKAKIIKALEDSKLETNEEFELNEIEATYNAALAAINKSDITKLSYKQLDAYIDNNVTNLTSTKAFMKKLSKVVLAMIKR